MRVLCTECGHKARISHSVPMTDNGAVRDLYCQCLDTLCGHTFVMSLAYKHTINPPASSHHRRILDALRTLPLNEQRALFEQLAG